MKNYLVLNEEGSLNVINENDYKSTYDMLSSNLEGLVEVVSWIPQFAEKGIDLWINEEGKLRNFKPTIAVKVGNQYSDVICGKILFSKYNNDGDTVPLSKDDVLYIVDVLEEQRKEIQFYNSYTGNFISNVVSVFEL